MVHGGQKMWKIAQNGQKCAHSWVGQMRHMPNLDQSVPEDWYQFICVQHIFWASLKPLRFWEWQGRQVSP